MAIYDIDGNEIASSSSSEQGNFLFHPWLPPTEPAQTALAKYKYADFITNTYEALRATYPDYISRSVIGQDESGTYDVYQYTFEPDNAEQTIFLQSGTHAGTERAGYISTYLLLKHICENWDTHAGLRYLRWSCRIVVVPIVNPWGADNNKSTNSTGTNLNRDLTAKSQAETVAITNFFTSINTTYGVSFAFDYHTTTHSRFGDYMLSVNSGSGNLTIAKHVLYYLARKNCRDRLSSYLSTYNLSEDELYLPYVGNSLSDTTYVSWWSSQGIAGATVEHSDNGVWSTNGADSASITKAVENYGNQLIAHAYARFGNLTVF